MSLAPSIRAADLRALLRRPGYLGFVATVSLSRIAGTMFMTAGVLLVLQRTGNAALAGVTAAAAVIPGALSGPFLGALLDVVRHRRVLIVLDQLTSVVALAAILALAGHAPNWTVPAVAVIYSATRPLSTGSFTSALSEIAGAPLLDQASAIEATSLNLAVVVGPALAGVLAGAAGPAAAVEIQAVLTVAVAGVIAVNPVFEVRPHERATDVSQAVRDGTRALVRHRILRTTSAAGTLAGMSWGPLAGSLAAGFGLITLTGVLEGPAYSGSISLRQRHAPAAVRAQVMTTLTSIAQVAFAAGAAISGVISAPLPAILAFVGVNWVAASVAAAGRERA